jgi:4-diphosphocytidyl-2-C-methyl-D-erythritol kinase
MIKKKAFAKLNLNLHILPQKNSNGYHPVRFINTQMALHDELLFEPAQGIEVICDHEEMPKQEDNLVYKAATLLREMDSQKRGIKITIKKNIPIRAGLGGGSSDAAVTINTLSELWNINITENQRKRLADILGKDVHYSLSGGVAEIGGDGDEVIPLPFNTPQFWIVIVVPRETKPSTGWMYAQIDKTKIGQAIHFLPKIKEAMKTKNGNDFLNSVFNDFENDIFKYFPVTLTIRQDLKDAGASMTLLCGSGSSMIGFFTTEDQAAKAKELLANKYKDVIISKLN